MSDRRISKAQRKAAREGLNRFLSVLLSLAMVLQTSPVAYARWDEGAAVVPQEEVVPAEGQATPEGEAITEEPAAEPEAPAAEPAAEPEATPEPNVKLYGFDATAPTAIPGPEATSAPES